MVTSLRYIIVLATLVLAFTSSLAQADTTVGEAQTIARLYSAALDRPPLTGGLNFFINSLEAGRSVISISEDFVLSSEFEAKYGELDNVRYIERLFLNVLGRPGAQGGVDFWVGNLVDGQSRAFVLARFADSPENIAGTAALYDSMRLVGGQWQYGEAEIVLPGCADDSSCASNPPLVIGADRPAEVLIPSEYTSTTRYPLIIVLHGYGSFGSQQSEYLGLDDRVDTKQYIMVRPDGTANANGTRFWNATPACCADVAEFEDNSGEDYTQIDDVAYIRSLIEEASRTYSIDTSRIGLFGHSNGGFMALRMACESSDYVTALVSLAGSTFDDPATCAPATNPVSVLTIHGDLDETISYAEGAIGPESYPGALETSKRFASLAGCDADNPVMQDNLDVVGNIDGAESTVRTYTDCNKGSSVEFWTIVGGTHIPFPWVSSAQDLYVDWLIDHPRN